METLIANGFEIRYYFVLPGSNWDGNEKIVTYCGFNIPYFSFEGED